MKQSVTRSPWYYVPKLCTVSLFYVWNLHIIIQFSDAFRRSKYDRSVAWCLRGTATAGATLHIYTTCQDKGPVSRKILSPVTNLYVSSMNVLAAIVFLLLKITSDPRFSLKKPRYWTPRTAERGLSSLLRFFKKLVPEPHSWEKRRLSSLVVYHRSNVGIVISGRAWTALGDTKLEAGVTILHCAVAFPPWLIQSSVHGGAGRAFPEPKNLKLIQ